jgi:hypothetical protein
MMTDAKAFFRLSLTGLLVWALGACRPPSLPATPEPVTLRFTYWGSPESL